MAQFSLSLINKHGTTVLTDYDTMAGKTAGLTFDEHLNLNVDGSTLDFSMLKYLYEGSQKVVNTPTVSITYGSIIKCLHNGHRYDFAVTDINYQFLAENLQLTFSAQDYFQYETSKLGIGYTITSDTTDPSYFGAQPIDAWVYKIIQDNNLRWGYVPINQANREWINIALTSDQKSQTFDLRPREDGKDYWENAETEAAANNGKVEYTLNQWVSFECSDSTAYNALKQLAAENGLMIMVDYAAHNFWFAPKQNIIFNGYYFNPNNNLQQFSVKGSAQNLVTVLNVTGPQDLNNHEVTLVPQLPTQIVNWIASTDWDRSVYYSGLYAAHTSDLEFLRESAYTPWLENKLIDISFFQDNHLLLSTEAQQIQDILYNQLRRINGRLLVEQNAYLTKYGEDYSKFTQQIIDTEGVSASMYGDIDAVKNLLFSNRPVCFASLDEQHKPWVYWPNGYTLSGPKGDVTLDSMKPYGAYYGFLETPDTPTLITQYFTPETPLTTSITLTVGTKAYPYPLCTINNTNNLVYHGTLQTVSRHGEWLLSPTEAIPLSVDAGTITIPKWCSEAIIHFSTQEDVSENVYFKCSSTDSTKIQYSTNPYTTSVSTWATLSSDAQNPSQIITPINITLWGSVDRNNCMIIHVTTNAVVAKTGFNVLNTRDTSALTTTWSYDNDNLECQSVLGFNNFGLQLTTTNTCNKQVVLHVNGVNTTIGPGQLLSDTVITEKDYTLSTDFSGKIQHIQILEGPLELYGKITIGNNTIITNSLTISDVDGQPSGPLLFTNLYSAAQFTNKKGASAHTIIPDQLNTLCGTRENYAQTLAKNSWELFKLWNTIYSDASYTLGFAVLKFQNVALFPDGSEEIISEDPYNSLYYYGAPTDAVFSEQDCIFLHQVLGVASADPLYRTTIVQYLAQLHSSITEKWNNCYAAAMGLGVYWPQEWNNSQWLMNPDNYTMIQSEAELVQLLSPLLPIRWDEPYTSDNIRLNTQFLPLNRRPKTTITVLNSGAGQTKTIYSYLDTEEPDAVPIQITYILEVPANYYIIHNFTMSVGESKTITEPNYWGQCIFTYSRTNEPSGTIVTAKMQSFNENTSFTITAQKEWSSSLQPAKCIYTTYQFRDVAEVNYNGLQAVTDNTQLRPQLLTPLDDPTEVNNSYEWAYSQTVDANHLKLYKTQHNFTIERSLPDISDTIVPAQILALPFPNNNYDSADYHANLPLYNIYTLSQQTLYDRSHYYTYLQQHNDIWRHLYQTYPGIFRESTYSNTTATNSQDLYIAAKAQLDNLSRPSFEYTLTGMDIYMHDSDYIPTRLKLGEQIRIDYQDPDQLTDTLNAALREPLYITGISHALRNDGDYQFTVTTRTATDTMVQRFAQLLSFGR